MVEEEAQLATKANSIDTLVAASTRQRTVESNSPLFGEDEECIDYGELEEDLHDNVLEEGEEDPSTMAAKEGVDIQVSEST